MKRNKCVADRPFPLLLFPQNEIHQRVANKSRVNTSWLESSHVLSSSLFHYFFPTRNDWNVYHAICGQCPSKNQQPNDLKRRPSKIRPAGQQSLVINSIHVTDIASRVSFHIFITRNFTFFRKLHIRFYFLRSYRSDAAKIVRTPRAKDMVPSPRGFHTLLKDIFPFSPFYTHTSQTDKTKHTSQATNSPILNFSLCSGFCSADSVPYAGQQTFKNSTWRAIDSIYKHKKLDLIERQYYCFRHLSMWKLRKLTTPWSH